MNKGWMNQLVMVFWSTVAATHVYVAALRCATASSRHVVANNCFHLHEVILWVISPSSSLSNASTWSLCKQSEPSCNRLYFTIYHFTSKLTWRLQTHDWQLDAGKYRWVKTCILHIISFTMIGWMVERTRVVRRVLCLVAYYYYTLVRWYEHITWTVSCKTIPAGSDCSLSPARTKRTCKHYCTSERPNEHMDLVVE